MSNDYELQTKQSNELSTHFQELQSEAREYLTNSKANNTKRAYGSD
ncbi:hypothetical protein [Oceanobacillus limi]|nr:hypothetical protein [Oceanobacillus limi]